MRLLIATGVYRPDIGGPATYVKILEENLPEHGISVAVEPFRRVARLPWGVRHLSYCYFLIRAGKDANLIYALDPISVGIPAMIAARVLKKRFIVRIAGDYAWEQGVQRFGVKDHLDVFSKKNDDYLIPVLVLKKFQKMVAGYAEKVIVPSKYFKGVIENWGIPSHKLRVIYSVAEDIPYQGRRPDLKGMLRFNGKIVASAGRLVPWKGFEALIAIVPQLIRKYPSFKLLIAGDGPLMKKLAQMVTRKKLDEYVALTGSLERAVLFKYLRVADVFVLNTDYEGLSHQLLEVMGIGTPIITTRVGGNEELIEHKKNGLLVRFNNKKELYESIVSVLDNQNLSERLVKNAKTTLKRFEADSMVKHLVEELQ